MKNSEFRIKYFIIALLLSLGMLLGAYKLYIGNFIEAGLEEEIVQLSFVDDVQVNKDGKEYNIYVVMKKAGNVKKDYQEIKTIIQDQLKQGNYRIDLSDGRDDRLQELYDEMLPGIYQAVANTDYLWLSENLKQMAHEAKCEAKMYMDDENIYIQIQSNNNNSAFLYELVKWSQTQKDGV